MNLTEKINDDFTKALKSKDNEKLSVLRMLKSSIKNSEIAEKKELDDSLVVKIIQKEVKQRKDSILSFTNAGRGDLAAKEQTEINYLEEYLPEQLSEEEIEKHVILAIEECEASGISDFGKVMSFLMPKISGKASGDAISAKVKMLLQSSDVVRK